MPKTADYVTSVKVVDEPLDATVTPARGEPGGVDEEAASDNAEVTISPANDVVQFDAQAASSNTGNIRVKIGTTEAIVLEPGQSWSVLSRFDLSQVTFIIRETGDKLRAVYLERVT